METNSEGHLPPLSALSIPPTPFHGCRPSCATGVNLNYTWEGGQHGSCTSHPVATSSSLTATQATVLTSHSRPPASGLVLGVTTHSLACGRTCPSTSSRTCPSTPSCTCPSTSSRARLGSGSLQLGPDLQPSHGPPSRCSQLTPGLWCVAVHALLSSAVTQSCGPVLPALCPPSRHALRATDSLTARIFVSSRSAQYLPLARGFPPSRREAE